MAGPLYLDSSALAKVYFPEAESADVDRLLRGRTDLQLSDLALTEVISAAGHRQREGRLDASAVHQLARQLLDDADGGLFARPSLDAPTHREAERILVASERVPLRTLGALHLALAAAAGARTIVTYDPRLAAAATAAGLWSWPPSVGGAKKRRRR